jgi:hypothetical protein
MKKIINSESIIGGGWGCFFAGLGCGAAVGATIALGWSPAAIIPGLRAVAACGAAVYVCG